MSYADGAQEDESSPSCESPRPRRFPLGFSSLFQLEGREYERNGFCRPYGKLNWLTAEANSFVLLHRCLYARDCQIDLQCTLSFPNNMHLVHRCLSEAQRPSPPNEGGPGGNVLVAESQERLATESLLRRPAQGHKIENRPKAVFYLLMKNHQKNAISRAFIVLT